MCCAVVPELPLETLYRCSAGILNDSHYDINRRMKPPINIKRIDIAKTVANLEKFAEKLDQEMPSISSNNDLSNPISSYIYEAIRNQITEEIYQPKKTIETVILPTSKQLQRLIL